MGTAVRWAAAQAERKWSWGGRGRWLGRGRKGVTLGGRGRLAGPWVPRNAGPDRERLQPPQSAPRLFFLFPRPRVESSSPLAFTPHLGQSIRGPSPPHRGPSGNALPGCSACMRLPRPHGPVPRPNWPAPGRGRAESLLSGRGHAAIARRLTSRRAKAGARGLGGLVAGAGRPDEARPRPRAEGARRSRTQF